VNNLLDDSDDEDDLRPARSRHQDREITLGTTMILLIFFALAVYGAALFGFGYSLGSKHTAGTAAVIAGGSNVTSGGFKPSPGSPVGSAGTDKIPPVDPKTLPSYTTPPPTAQTKTVPIPPSSTADSSVDDSEPKPRTSPPATAVPTVASIPASGATPPSGPPIVVQVAALSHQEDAELIATTLQKRGYAVKVRTDADKLFHVQVGPFYARKDADAMKAKLLADGFNAYIKQ
jgi:DedD protein